MIFIHQIHNIILYIDDPSPTGDLQLTSKEAKACNTQPCNGQTKPLGGHTRHQPWGLKGYIYWGSTEKNYLKLMVTHQPVTGTHLGKIRVYSLFNQFGSPVGVCNPRIVGIRPRRV
jgi:hypothetical protein